MGLEISKKPCKGQKRTYFPSLYMNLLVAASYNMTGKEFVFLFSHRARIFSMYFFFFFSFGRPNRILLHTPSEQFLLQMTSELNIET